MTPSSVGWCVKISLVSSRATDHDRAPDAVDPDPEVPMRAALDGLRLTGAVFLRGGVHRELGLRVAARRGRRLRARARTRAGSSSFHVVASGRCWVEVDSGERHWAAAGDVIVLPYGDSHRMGGIERRRAGLRGHLRHAAAVVGDAGDPLRRRAATRPMSCAATSPPTTRSSTPRLRALPPVFVVSPTTPTAQAFVRANIDYALQQTSLVAENRVEVPTEVPRLLLDRGPADPPGQRARVAVGLAARAARPGPRARAGRAARGRGSQVDGRGAVPVVAGVGVARSTSASATCWGCRRSATSPSGGCTRPAPAVEHGAVDRGRGAPGRLRLGGGVQPGVQARPRRLTEPLAGRDELRGLRLTRRRGVRGRPRRPDRCRAHAASRRTRARPGVPPAPRRHR